MTKIKNTLFFIFILLYSFSAFSEQTVEEIFKERKSIFSKNYKLQKELIVLLLMEILMKQKN
jgi:hypothetical protein